MLGCLGPQPPKPPATGPKSSRGGGLGSGSEPKGPPTGAGKAQMGKGLQPRAAVGRERQQKKEECEALPVPDGEGAEPEGQGSPSHLLTMASPPVALDKQRQRRTATACTPGSTRRCTEPRTATPPPLPRILPHGVRHRRPHVSWCMSLCSPEGLG